MQHLDGGTQSARHGMARACASARLAAVLSLACLILGACAGSGAFGLFGAHPLRAEATLAPTGDHTAHGTVALMERPEGVQITYDIVGLAPNTAHTFALHQGSDCGGAAASHAGPRLASDDIAPPRTSSAARTGGPAGGIDGGAQGSLARISADGTGAAVGFFVLQGLSLDGLRSIVGRTLVVHIGVDRTSAKRASPAASGAPAATRYRPDPAGAALACGVVSR